MLFTSIYHHTIDAKNRLAIPVAFRKQLEQAGESTLVVRPRWDNTGGLVRHYLELMPLSYFQKGTGLEVTEHQLNLSAAEVDLVDATYADVVLVTLDSQNRILIPEDVMLRAGQEDPLNKRFLGTNVCVVGHRDRITVWNESDYIEYVKAREAKKAALQAAADRPT